MKKNLLLLLFICSLNYVKAQRPVFKEATVARPAQFWNLLLLTESNNTNQLNGVQFYYHDNECNSEKINLIKLINLNKYSVKILFQTDVKEVSVLVPALTSIEGSCSSSDLNSLKLWVPFTNGNETTTPLTLFKVTVSKAQ